MLIAVLSLCFTVISCQTVRDIFENIGANFSESRKVLNKVEKPYNGNTRLSALWVGHATVLIQMDDKMIVFDPFFTNTIAELQKRIYEPGIDLESINKLDLILISHSHFDHLNFGTLSLLEEKFPDIPLVFPEGMEEFLPEYSFDFVRMKRASGKKNSYIGETKIIKGIKVTSVAAYHWGGRYGLDGLIWGKDTYTGFILQYKGNTVYFSGDTAYDDVFFKYIGNHYIIDLALIPIGPCKDCNENENPYRHIYPKGALMILDDIKSAHMIPIHFGTLRELSDPDLPKQVLMSLINDNPAYQEKVKILNIGEQFIIK